MSNIVKFNQNDVLINNKSKADADELVSLSGIVDDNEESTTAALADIESRVSDLETALSGVETLLSQI